MDKISIKGKIIFENDNWYLASEDRYYSADLLTGIDEILESNGEDACNNNDEIEVIIKIKREKIIL